MLLALHAEQALVCVISTNAESPWTLRTMPICLISSSITLKSVQSYEIIFIYASTRAIFLRKSVVFGEKKQIFIYLFFIFDNSSYLCMLICV